MKLFSLQRALIIRRINQDVMKPMAIDEHEKRYDRNLCISGGVFFFKFSLDFVFSKYKYSYKENVIYVI